MWKDSYGVSCKPSWDELGGSTWQFNLQLFADSDKTEPATPKKREDARKRGHVPRTMELGTGLVLLGGSFLLRNADRLLVQPLAQLMQISFSQWLTTPFTDEKFLQGISLVSGSVFLQVVAPIMGLAMLLGAGSQLVQVGFMFIGEGLKPKFSRINPVEGVKRIFSKRALAELAKAVLKIVIIGYLVYWAVSSRIGDFVGLLYAHPTEAAAATWNLICTIGMMVGGSMLAIALLDYLYQRYEYELNLRMSKEEVKEELNQTEGDPQIRSRIRQRQRQIAASRMMQQVPTADVVITNPTEIAVALRYDEMTMDAPTIVAMGAGFVAQRIREIARANNVPVVENKPLARALFTTAQVGDMIPVELYQAVAEVLSVIYQMRNRRI